MIKKVLSIFAIVFVAKTLISCCECGEAFDYLINYSSVKSAYYDTSSFEDVLVTEKVLKESFGMTVSVLFELQKVTTVSSIFKEFGFNTALACSCIDDSFSYNDAITDIKIFLLNDINEKKDVTTFFNKTAFHDNENLSWLSADYTEDHLDGFYYELIYPDSLTGKSDFYIEVSLESGEVLTEDPNPIELY